MFIFACTRCKKYCAVLGGMFSECCKAELYLPEHNKIAEKRKANVL